MIKYFYIYICFTVTLIASVTTNLHAQFQYKADSLLQVLNQYQKEDSTKVKMYSELAWAFYDVDNHKMKDYTEKGIALAKKINYTEANKNLYNNMGVVFWTSGDYNKSLEQFQKSVQEAKKVNDERLAIIVTSNIGLIYITQGEYFKAFQIHKKVYETALKRDDNYAIVLALVNIIEDFMVGEQYEETLHYLDILNKELSQRENAFDQAEKMNWYLEMHYLYAQAYHLTGNASKANKHLKEAFQIALKYFPKAPQATAKLYYLQGLIFLARKEYTKASNALLKSNTQAKKGAESFVMLSATKLSSLAINTHKPSQAIQWAKKALKAAQEDVESKQATQESYHNLSLAYAELEQYKLAHRYAQKEATIKHKLSTTLNSSEFELLAFENKAEQTKSANKILIAKKEKQKQQLSAQYLGIGALIGALALSLLVVFFFYRRNRKKQQTNEELRQIVKEQTKNIEETISRLTETNEELERFSYTASHDLKEPLRNINDFVNLIEASTKGKINTATQNRFSNIKKDAVYMQELIYDVLSYVQVGLNSHKNAAVNLQEIFNETARDLSDILQAKNAKLVVKEQLPTIVTCTVKLKHIFRQMILRGISQNDDPNPTIEVRYSMHNGHHQIYFVDNGNPIKHREDRDLFSILHETEENDSVNLGLALCYKAVQKLEGEIEITTGDAKENTILVWFPEKEAEQAA